MGEPLAGVCVGMLTGQRFDAQEIEKARLPVIVNAAGDPISDPKLYLDLMNQQVFEKTGQTNYYEDICRMPDGTTRLMLLGSVKSLEPGDEPKEALSETDRWAGSVMTGACAMIGLLSYGPVGAAAGFGVGLKLQQKLRHIRKERDGEYFVEPNDGERLAEALNPNKVLDFLSNDTLRATAVVSFGLAGGPLGAGIAYNLTEDC